MNKENRLNDDALDAVSGGVLKDEGELMNYLSMVKGFGMDKNAIIAQINDDNNWANNYQRFATDIGDRDDLISWVNNNWDNA